MNKLLIVGGLLLILSGNLFGAVYAGAYLPTVKKEQNETLKNAIKISSESATGALLEADKYVNKTLFAGRSSNVHSHMTLIGILSLAISYITPYLRLSDGVILVANLMLLSSGLFLPLGIFIETWHIRIGSSMAMFGGMALLLAISIFLIGAIRMESK